MNEKQDLNTLINAIDQCIYQFVDLQDLNMEELFRIKKVLRELWIQVNCRLDDKIEKQEEKINNVSKSTTEIC